MKILLERRTDDPLIALDRKMDEATLRAALDCQEFERLEDRAFRMNCAPVTQGCAVICQPSWSCPSTPSAERSSSWPRWSWRGNRDLPPDAPDEFVPPGGCVSLYRDKDKTGRAARRR